MEMTIRNALFGLMSGLLLLSPMAAQAEVITFDPLEVATGSQTSMATYDEAGFRINNAASGSPLALSSWTQDSPHYAGSAGLWVNFGNSGVGRLRAINGDPFSIQSVDMSERLLSNGGPAVVPFVGYLSGGGTVSTTFTTDDLFGFETFTFDNTWTDLIEIRFTNTQCGFGARCAQYDNFVLTVAGQDSDGDGVPDDDDICEGFDDNADGDGDGIPDGCDDCPIDANNDSDGDGSCDSVDLCIGDDASGDFDNDGLCDDTDICIGTSNSDVDGDGICDEGDLCFGDDATGNDDGDGVCNDLDVCLGDDAFGDTDSDGTCDDIDACPVDAENDADGDGVCEVDDNCDAEANPNQSDNDGDGAGDVCDTDDDNDGALDDADNCPLDANSDQADFDGDGAGDVCDTDDDNDGVLDAVDACETAIGDLVNADGCSIANLCPCDNNWKNHGAYVRCVAHAANDFVDLGLISLTEHGDIVSAAGQSACGKKN